MNIEMKVLLKDAGLIISFNKGFGRAFCDRGEIFPTEGMNENS